MDNKLHISWYMLHRLGFTEHGKDLSWKNGTHTEDSLIFTHIRRKALMSLSLHEVKFWWAPFLGRWGDQHRGKYITFHHWEWLTDFKRNAVFLCPSFQRLKTQHIFFEQTRWAKHELSLKLIFCKRLKTMPLLLTLNTLLAHK